MSTQKRSATWWQKVATMLYRYPLNNLKIVDACLHFLSSKCMLNEVGMLYKAYSGAVIHYNHIDMWVNRIALPLQNCNRRSRSNTPRFLTHDTSYTDSSTLYRKQSIIHEIVLVLTTCNRFVLIKNAYMCNEKPNFFVKKSTTIKMKRLRAILN